MIKGHTKIELTNIKTGEKKTVEKHNLVTNGVASLYGKLTNDYVLNSDVDLYFGGLLLFENPIDENVDNYHLPLGNRMIGNGAVGYAPLTPPEFGSYNADESTLTIENGTVTRKYVYDFSTSKGNGTISAVSLTNKYCGYHGLGNKNDYTQTPSNYLDQLDKIYTFWDFTLLNKTNSDYSSEILEVNYTKNIIITWKGTDSGLQLFYIYYPFSKLNPLLQPGTIYKSVTIPFPEKITSVLGTSFYKSVISTPDGNYMLFTKNNYCSPNEKLFVWKVSESFVESDIYELTLPDGVTLHNQYNYNNCYTVAENYFICKPLTSDEIFKIKLTNPTDVKKIQFTDNFNSTSYNSEKYLFNWNGKILVSPFRYSGNTPCTFMYDYVNDVIGRVNPQLTFVHGNNQYAKHFYIKGVSDRIAVFIRGEVDGGSYPNAIYRNWLVLSTINNLPEPVTKTSDMTMKVTYTITGKIEPEE